MFEDEFSALQADMVDICNEYSKGMADKIFIYAANEGMILVQHFYCINFNLYKCSKLNNAGVKVNFDTSDGCQETKIYKKLNLFATNMGSRYPN